MDTTQPIPFRKHTVSDVDLSGYGCPECGDPKFKRVVNSTEYRSEECFGAWDKSGDHEITDYGDSEYGDSDSHGYEGGFECDGCGHEYGEDEAELADHFVGHGDDEDGSCLAVCADMECDGSCRTEALWPFLGDAGVVRYDAVGAQLEALAPGTHRFALDERLGFTVIIADPECREARGNWRENNGPMPCCTICKGDMTTAYHRTTHLPHRQERYSTVRGTTTVTMQLQQSICYVCHTG